MSDEPEPRSIAVALSGGGHRACVFALGVLLYLAKSGCHARVASISSVSGGSLANAAIGDQLDFTTDGYAKLEPAARRVAREAGGRRFAPEGGMRRLLMLVILAWAVAALVGVWFMPVDPIVHVGALVLGVAVLLMLVGVVVTGAGSVFGWWGTWAYLAAVILWVELVAVGAPRLKGSETFADLLGLVGRREWSTSTVLVVVIMIIGFVLAAYAASVRGRVVGRAFANRLFANGARTRLDSLPGSLDQIVCATDLHAGHHVYFSGDFVYGYDFGVGHPGSVRLHEAVQASAAFPGAFPPRFMRASRFVFKREQPAIASRLVLVDGGVYDNMADQWARGFDRRLRSLRRFGVSPRSADELVVVSASAGLRADALKRFRVPLLGELFALLRDKSVMYDNGNSLRRQELVTTWDLARATTGRSTGALVHIEQSPLHVPGHFAKAPDSDDRKARALDVQARLLEAADEREWQAMADANALVPTTLVALTDDVVARLLHHAYVLAMVNLHVILGYPLGAIPDRGRFIALLHGEGDALPWDVSPANAGT